MQQNSLSTFNTQQSAAQANQILQAANPAGSQLEASQKNLEDLGFHCQALGTAGSGYRASILCTLPPSVPKSGSPVAAPMVPVTWMVEIHSTDGASLTKLKASRIPKDIGE